MKKYTSILFSSIFSCAVAALAQPAPGPGTSVSPKSIICRSGAKSFSLERDPIDYAKYGRLEAAGRSDDPNIPALDLHFREENCRFGQDPRILLCEWSGCGGSNLESVKRTEERIDESSPTKGSVETVKFRVTLTHVPGKGGGPAKSLELLFEEKDCSVVY